jgi:hypothetical protein
MADGGITELLTDFITTTFRWLLRIPLMVLAVLITPLSSSSSAGDANEVPLAVPTDVATSAAPLPGSATQARTKQGWAVSRIRTVWGYDRRWRDEGELHIFFVGGGNRLAVLPLPCCTVVAWKQATGHQVHTGKIHH